MGTIYVESEVEHELATPLDNMLKRNPHYAWCRKLGQLQPPRHFIISAGGNETFFSNEVMQGKRIGEIKPRVLSLQSG